MKRYETAMKRVKDPDPITHTQYPQRFMGVSYRFMGV